MQDPSRYACARIRWNLVPTFTPFPINLVHCSRRAKLWILGTVSRIIPPATSSPPRAQSRKLLKPRLEIQRTDGRRKIGRKCDQYPRQLLGSPSSEGTYFESARNRSDTSRSSSQRKIERIVCIAYVKGEFSIFFSWMYFARDRIT